jgi:hypothetical protein
MIHDDIRESLPSFLCVSGIQFCCSLAHSTPEETSLHRATFCSSLIKLYPPRQGALVSAFSFSLENFLTSLHLSNHSKFTIKLKQLVFRAQHGNSEINDSRFEFGEKKGSNLVRIVPQKNASRRAKILLITRRAGPTEKQLTLIQFTQN